MKPFEFFLRKKLVRKSSQNLARARFLIKDAEIRIKFMENINLSEHPKMFFENTYDIIRNLCDAVLFVDGYKPYSHEASISYLVNKGLDAITVSKLDLFRQKRNASKYEGEPITENDAKNIKELYSKIKNALDNMLKGAK